MHSFHQQQTLLPGGPHSHLHRRVPTWAPQLCVLSHSPMEKGYNKGSKRAHQVHTPDYWALPGSDWGPCEVGDYRQRIFQGNDQPQEPCFLPPSLPGSLGVQQRASSSLPRQGCHSKHHCSAEAGRGGETPLLRSWVSPEEEWSLTLRFTHSTST